MSDFEFPFSFPHHLLTNFPFPFVLSVPRLRLPLLAALLVSTSLRLVAFLTTLRCSGKHPIRAPYPMVSHLASISRICAQSSSKLLPCSKHNPFLRCSRSRVGSLSDIGFRTTRSAARAGVEAVCICISDVVYPPYEFINIWFSITSCVCASSCLDSKQSHVDGAQCASFSNERDRGRARLVRQIEGHQSASFSLNLPSWDSHWAWTPGPSSMPIFQRGGRW